jgi:hypothetical protein
MDFKVAFFRFPIFTLLLILSFALACSTPSWLPIKTRSPKKEVSHKAKMKELLDKEVVIIDRQEYVKTPNPMASEGGDQPKYLYVPVDEYLSKKDAYSAPSTATRKEVVKKEGSSPSSTMPLSRPVDKDKEVFLVTSSLSTTSELRKKIVIAPFDDQTTHTEEVVGDWIAEKVVKEINRKSKQILFVDYQMIKEFLEEKGIALTELETPRVLHLVNEVFGIHALLVGYLSGPYVFTTKGVKDQDGTASAIVKVEVRIIDTLSGKILKTLSVSNPILATKGKGPFSEEKAKANAIDLAIADLTRSLPRELDGLDWFCRVAKVDGEEIYINAGGLTGIRVGDVMEVFQPGGTGGRGEVKGRIQISACFGIDASIGKLIYGKQPDVNDILKITHRGAT